MRSWAWPASTGVTTPRDGDPVGPPPGGGQLLGHYRPEAGPLDPVPSAVEGAADLTGQDLPPGPAQAEAVAARLQLAGRALVWGGTDPVGSLAELEALGRERGRSSLEMVRADPLLLPALALGAWSNAGWRVRSLRRVLLVLPGLRHLARAPHCPPGWTWRIRADAAFWAGVRRHATPTEWRRLTRSYVVLNYHRLAGERRTGQDQIDVAPRRFDRHMAILRLLRYRPLTAAELVRFHTDPSSVVPRRGYLATFDDGYADNAGPLTRHAGHRPLLFVPTAEPGRVAHWAAGEPLLDWDELAGLERAGVAIGSHTRHHASLPRVSPAERRDELVGSRRDLAEHLARPVDAIAYPHGRHDAGTRRAAAEAGFTLGFTTAPGRNGAGTDQLSLRRVGIWSDDGSLRFLWKLWTAEMGPRLLTRVRPGSPSGPGSGSGPAS